MKSLTFDKLYGDTKYDCILMFNVFLQDIKNTLFKHIENLTAYEKRLFLIYIILTLIMNNTNFKKALKLLPNF